MTQSVATSGGWRQQEETSSSAKWISASLLIVALLALIALFVWLLWPQSIPQSVLIVASPGVYDPDVDGIGYSDLVHENFQAGNVPMELAPRTLKSDADLEKLGNNLQIDGVEAEITCLLICAHGVSQINRDGTSAEPLLLASNFRFPRKIKDGVAQGLDPGDLIDEVANLPSKTKLLLLDASFLETDFRFGMGVNEFPFLVEQHVREEVDDPHLWIIMSTGMLNPAGVSYQSEYQGSIFMNAVQRSLLELGDRNGISPTETVALLTLYQRISQHCLAMTANQQRPILLRGGTGLIGSEADSDDLDDARQTTVFLPILDNAEPEDESEAESGESTKEDGSDQDSSARRMQFSDSMFAAVRRVTLTVSQATAHAVIDHAPTNQHWLPAALVGVATWLQQEDRDTDASTAGDEQTEDDAASPMNESQEADATGSEDDSSSDEQPEQPEVTPAESRSQRLDAFLTEFEEGTLNELDLTLFQIKLSLERLHHRDNPGGWSPVDFARTNGTGFCNRLVGWWNGLIPCRPIGMSSRSGCKKRSGFATN